MQIINVLAILFSPIIAVLITLWYQKRKEKKDLQKTIFINLLSYRKSTPPAKEWVDGLNVIDAVYHEYPEVVKLWHEYFALLCQNYNENVQEREHKYLELLHSIATALGYKKIKQTDLDKFYAPQYYADQQIRYGKLTDEMIRVFENTERFLVEKKEQKDD